MSAKKPKKPDNHRATIAGIQTTEFWISAVVAVAGMITMLGLPDEHVAVRVAGAVLTVASGLGYTWVRGQVKRANAPYNEPPPDPDEDDDPEDDDGTRAPVDKTDVRKLPAA